MNTLSLKPKPALQPNADNFFVVKNHDGLHAARFWLEKREYNVVVMSRDRKGNDLFGLSWHEEANHNAGTPVSREKRGIVMVSEESILRATALAILDRMTTGDDPDAEEWRQTQISLWKDISFIP